MTSLTASDPPCKLALATNLDLIRCEMVLRTPGADGFAFGWNFKMGL